MKYLIGINTLSTISQSIYSNHIQFFFRTSKAHVNDTFALMTPQRMSIDRMRNESVRLAMENEFDYVVFLDDDILVPENLDIIGRWSELMEKHNADVIAANVVIRGYPYNNMFFKWNEGKTKLDFYNDLPKDARFIRVDAIGCSLVMFKVETLKKIQPPYFVTGPYNTEDIYFCLKAAKSLEDFRCFVDLDVECGHLLMPIPVMASNKHLLIEFEEKQDPSIKPTEQSPDRGDSYHKEVEETIECQKQIQPLSISVVDKTSLVDSSM